MTEPKHALFVMPSSLIGGAERVAFNLASFLLSNGWHVSLVTMSRGRSPGWDQFDSHANFQWTAIAGRSDKFNIPLVFAMLTQLTHRCRFSFVYSSHLHVNAMLSFLRKARLLRTHALIARESTVIFMRNTAYPHFIFRALYHLYGGIDVLICQTSLMKSHLLDAVPHLQGMPVKVIPNPVNVEYIDRCVAQGDDQENDAAIDFVFCGRLIPLKRPDLLLHALARLKSDSWRSAHFLGEGEIDKLRSLAADLGIVDRVVFRGAVDNPYAIFARARVGVLTSTIEGFPNVLLEMMTAGTGRIISSLCTPAVLTLPGVDIVDPISCERLAIALETALRGPIRTDQFRRHILEERSVDLYWNKILEFLNEKK